jgi:hypothetical protein
MAWALKTRTGLRSLRVVRRLLISGRAPASRRSAHRKPATLIVAGRTIGVIENDNAKRTLLLYFLASFPANFFGHLRRISREQQPNRGAIFPSQQGGLQDARRTSIKSISAQVGPTLRRPAPVLCRRGICHIANGGAGGRY